MKRPLALLATTAVAGALVLGTATTASADTIPIHPSQTTVGDDIRWGNMTGDDHLGAATTKVKFYAPVDNGVRSFNWHVAYHDASLNGTVKWNTDLDSITVPIDPDLIGGDQIEVDLSGTRGTSTVAIDYLLTFDGSNAKTAQTFQLSSTPSWDFTRHQFYKVGQIEAVAKSDEIVLRNSKGFWPDWTLTGWIDNNVDDKLVTVSRSADGSTLRARFPSSTSLPKVKGTLRLVDTFADDAVFKVIDIPLYFTTPPAVHLNKPKAKNHKVTLSWVPPKQRSDVSTYYVKVYLHDKVVKRVNVGNTRTAVIKHLKNGKPYRFAVAAKNRNGIGKYTARSAIARPHR